MRLLLITAAKRSAMVYYAAELANALSKKHTVYVLCPEGIDDKTFNSRVKLIHLKIINGLKDLANISSFITLRKLLAYLKPDVIHILITHPWIAANIYQLKKFPLVFTVHDVNMHEGEHFKMIKTMSNYISIKNTDWLIVHGENAKTQALQKFPELSHHTTRIPIGEFKFMTNYSRKHIRERNNILFFGRIRDYKGLQYLIKAQPLIMKEIPNFKIIIAGSGNITPYLKLIHNSQYFEIHNHFLSEYEIAEHMQQAAVVALPYVSATQSGVVPTCYAFKKPVVVTNVGDILEIVTHKKTGLIVPPKDTRALADALIYLLKHSKERKQMGLRAYRLMRQEFNWDKIVKATTKVYEQATRRKNENRNYY